MNKTKQEEYISKLKKIAHYMEDESNNVDSEVLDRLNQLIEDMEYDLR